VKRLKVNLWYVLMQISVCSVHAVTHMRQKTPPKSCYFHQICNFVLWKRPHVVSPSALNMQCNARDIVNSESGQVVLCVLQPREIPYVSISFWYVDESWNWLGNCDNSGLATFAIFKDTIVAFPVCCFLDGMSISL